VVTRIPTQVQELGWGGLESRETRKRIMATPISYDARTCVDDFLA
jgi:hypothetical protein